MSLLFAGVNMQAQSIASEQMDERFSNGAQLPYGWFTEGWSVADNAVQTPAPAGGFSFGGGSKQTFYLLTPPVEVREGELLSFSAKNSNTGFGGMGGNSTTFTLEKSLYGSSQWEQVQDFKDSLNADLKTFTVGGLGAGEYRFRFTASEGIIIDSVAGFHIDTAAPDLYVTVDSAVVRNINLGAVEADASKTIYVINTGTGTMHVNVSLSDETYFSLSTKELSVEAGDTAFVDVMFPYDPEKIGKYEATITFDPADERLFVQTIDVTASIPDPAIWLERFNDADAIPYGMFTEGWLVKDGKAQTEGSSSGFDFGNMMGGEGEGGGTSMPDFASMLGGGGATYYLLTPPLNVLEGEELLFLVKKGDDSNGLGGMGGDSSGGEGGSGGGMGDMFNQKTTLILERSVYGSGKWVKVQEFADELSKDEYTELKLSGTEPGEYRFRFKSSGSIYIDSISGHHIDMEAPDLYVTVDSFEVKSVDYGLVSQNTVKQFYVINTATGTLNVNISSTDENLFTVSQKSLSIAAGDSVLIDVTFLYDANRIGKSGATIVFEPTDTRLAIQKIDVAAVITEPGVWAEDFKGSNDLPAGWFAEGWTVNNGAAEAAADDGMGAMMGGSSSNYYLLTPTLTFENKKQAVVFSVKKTESDDDSGMGGMFGMFGGGSTSLIVERSVYGRNNWEQIKEITDSLTDEFQTFWVSDFNPGQYRLRFRTGGGVTIDSIAGAQIDTNAPDLYVTLDSAVVSRVNLGMLQQNVTKKFYVINTGSGTLNVSLMPTNPSFYTVNPEELSIEGRDSVLVDVNFIYQADLLGERIGDIVFTPADTRINQQQVELTAYTTYPDAWSENFEPEIVYVGEEYGVRDFPEGWETDGWLVKRDEPSGMGAMLGGMMPGGNDSWKAEAGSEEHELITPALQATQGDILYFQLGMGSGMAAMMGGGGESLQLFYSREGGEWTKAGEYTQAGGVIFKAPLNGVYRLKFVGKNINLDNFLGFHTPIESITLQEGEDNTELLAGYDGKVVNVNYSRVLSAKDNGDGTWSPKAYTICLPYDFPFNSYVESGQVGLYRLKYVDDYYNQFIFTNDFPFASAGYAYIVIVNYGSVKLDAINVRIAAQPVEEEIYSYKSVLDNPDNPTVAGYWTGTYRRIYDEEAEPLNMYGMQSDGRWERYYVTNHGPKWCWFDAFRAFFRAASPMASTFKAMFTYTGASDQIETGEIEEFPNVLFDDEYYNDEMATGISSIIRTVEADGSSRYFDLQGRQITAPTFKGIYIKNGKKFIK